jgi:hypothetical protein
LEEFTSKQRFVAAERDSSADSWGEMTQRHLNQKPENSIFLVPRVPQKKAANLPLLD